MGTSSLYGGPKKTALLPPNYDPEGNSEQDTPAAGNIPTAENPEEVKPQHEWSGKIEPTRINGEQSIQPTVSWGTVRGSMRKAMNNRSSGNVKNVIRNYTKALGGHTNATRQAAKARKTAGVIYTYFTGSPEIIRKKFEEVGIRFDGRPTNEIFYDICNFIAPVPNDLEDALVNKALRETFADVVADQSIDLNHFENFNEELLQKLIGGLIKHYVFDKLILQSEQTALKNCERTTSLRDLEKAIKQYIDGIVDSVVPDIVKSGMNPTDFNRALETLCDISYQQMEELR